MSVEARNALQEALPEFANMALSGVLATLVALARSARIGYRARGSTQDTFRFLEFFAGAAEITAACNRMGCSAKAFDLRYADSPYPQVAYRIHSDSTSVIVIALLVDSMLLSELMRFLLRAKTAQENSPPNF